MRSLEIPLGPWPLGLDNVDERDYPLGFTPEAENILFDGPGVATALKDFYGMSEAAPDYRTRHSVVEGGHLFAQGVPMEGQWQAPFYSDMNGTEVVATNAEVCVTYPAPVRYDRTRPAVVMTAGSTGGPGRTGVIAISKEGYSSVPVYSDSQSFTVFAPGGAMIAKTRPDGPDFYLYTQAPNLPGGVLVDISAGGHRALVPRDVLLARPIQLGGPVTLTNSRLFVARGRSVHYSDPFAFGVSRPSNFLSFPSPVRMIAGLGTNLFVGTRNGVSLVSDAGAGDNTSQRSVSGFRVLSHHFTRVPAGAVGMNGGPVVAWWTSAGVQLGIPDGSVVTPAARRVDVQSPEDGVITFHEGVFYYLQRG